MHNVARFFETMQNSRVAFIGTGVTNGDIIRLFRKKGIDVTLLDRKNPEQLGNNFRCLRQDSPQVKSPNL